MLDAMAALEEIADPVEQARALTRVLDENKHLSELRGEVVVRLLARKDATLRSVGDEIGLHWTTVKQIRDSYLKKQAKARAGE